MVKKRIKKKKRRQIDDNNYPVIRKYKILILVLIIIFTIGLLFFVFNKKSMYRCSKIVDQSGIGYKVKSSYDIYSEKNKVTYVEITDTIYSDDINILKQYKNDYMNKYEEQKNRYGGYTISADDEKGKTIIKTKIDYSKINFEVLKQEYRFIEEYIDNDSVTVEGARKIYSVDGALCE
ncbi:MAG: hypothetical protein IKF36_01215 [Bacilli bacterium]|nr:hypothetical protein [Bacilli bacterium]